MRVLKSFFIILIILLIAGNSLASPLLSEESAVLGQGRIGVFPLLLYTYYNTDYDDEGNRISFGGERSSADFYLYTEIFYGLTDLLTLRLAIPYDCWQDTAYGGDESSASGICDSEFKIMYNFIEEDESWPAFSGLAGVKFPSGDYAQGLGTGSTDWTVMAILDKSFGPWMGYLNLGYMYTGEFTDTTSTPTFRNDPGDRIQLNLALDYEVTEQLLLVADLMAEWITDSKADGVPMGGSSGSTVYLIPGINYLFTPDNVLYAGVQFPISAQLNSLMAGVTPSTGITLILGLYNEF